MQQTPAQKTKGALLIVDDEECIRDILSRHFSAEGYECRTAADVARAQDELKTSNFDLVLTDILMPGESGLSLLKDVRARFPQTGVVMITAVADTQVAVDAVKMGASDYITKPIHLEVAQTLVEQAMKRVQETSEQERYKGYLEGVVRRYVSPEMLNYVQRDHPIELVHSKLLNATVLFCDVRGFTALSRTCSPQELIPRLNKRFFEPATDIIMAKNGMINKFLGDGFLAVFGAPFSYEGHAAHAVEAAQELMARLHRAPEQAGEGFPIGIGIVTGKVLAGNIGSSKRMDFTVMGDAVNMAAQLEKIADAGEILLNQAAYDEVQSRVKAEPLQVSLKGHETQSTIFRIGAKS